MLTQLLGSVGFFSQSCLRFVHNFFLVLGDDFSALVAGLSNDVHLGPLKSHLESIQSEGPLPEPLTEPKRARIERKNNYSFVCKDGVKWLPQVRRNA